MSAPMTHALPPNVVKNLGDRSYEKRKQAALEIEHIIRDLNAAPHRQPEQIAALIQIISKEYAYSTQSNYRKGGLIGLAATAIALMEDTHTYLELLLPPVLKCFTDQESRVRYYACEALYNITKVARGSTLIFFCELFDGLCKLYSDVDLDVKNGAQLLDRLIKDVVTESEHFSIEKFIPLLRERIKIKNPFIRQLLVGWITVLDSVPDIDMLEYLPDYLSGLFDMLSDPNKDIRQQSYAALTDLLREITQSVETANAAAADTGRDPASSGAATSGSIDLPAIIVILVSTCQDSRDNFTRLTVLTWINELLLIGQPKTLLPFAADMLGVALACISDPEREIRAKSERTNEMLLHLVQATSESLNLYALLEKMTAQLHSKYVPSRLASLRWISMLLSKLPGALQPYFEGSLFPVLLRTLQDSDDFVVKLDLEVLARICLNAQSQIDADNFALVLHYILNLFRCDRKFMEIRGSFIVRSMCELLDAEEIYRKISSILAGAGGAESSGSAAASPAALAAASTASAINGSSSASILLSNDAHEDYDFTSLMIQTLNLILLTSVELAPLRNRLKHCLSALPVAGVGGVTAEDVAVAAKSQREGIDLFRALYASWIHNPIATFSLCLLTQTYYLSSEIVVRIATKVDISVNYLMQLDKLIQLIESPIFIHMRLKLLEAPQAANQHNMYLLKSLYGILMLLPQSTAFMSLKTRLESVAPLVLLMKGAAAAAEEAEKGAAAGEDKKKAAAAASASSSSASSSSVLESSLPIAELLANFERVQAKHSAKKQRQIKNASLIKKAATPAAVAAAPGGAAAPAAK